jgi:uncharacterized membrane protein YuzA (DUF378 family)
MPVRHGKGETMTRLRAIDWIALILAIIGALNWGLVGLFGFDIVAAIFGEMTALSRIVYILVGLAGIYLLISLGTLGRKAPAAEKEVAKPAS